MHNPKVTKPTMDLDKKTTPESELRVLIKNLAFQSRTKGSEWMDITSKENSDWNEGELPEEFFEGGPSTFKYKSFRQELAEFKAETPTPITQKSHPARKLAVRTLMFWFMRTATKEERLAMCPPGATKDEITKWHRDMGFQFGHAKGKTLKRCIALILHLISTKRFFKIDWNDEDQRRAFWDREITNPMLLFVFTFWRDAIDFRWIFATSSPNVEQHRGLDFGDVDEIELARDMDRQMRNRLVAWLDTVYLYAVDTVLGPDTEWPIACDDRVTLDLKLWGELSTDPMADYWFKRDLDDVPVGNGKFTRVVGKGKGKP